MKQTTVQDFLKSLQGMRELPVASADSPLEEVVRTMVKGHRRRMVYVVDSAGRLQGQITLNHLKEVIFHYYLNTAALDAIVVTSHINELFASEVARDVMDADLVVCRLDEPLHDVLVRMNESGLSDLPVIDHEWRLIADIDILDLLERWLNLGNEGF